MKIKSEIEASIYPIQDHTCVGNFPNNGLVLAGVMDESKRNNIGVSIEEITFYDAEFSYNSVSFYGNEIAVWGQDDENAKIVIGYSGTEYKFKDSFARELFTNRLRANTKEKTNLRVSIVVRT